MKPRAKAAQAREKFFFFYFSRAWIMQCCRLPYCAFTFTERRHFGFYDIIWLKLLSQSEHINHFFTISFIVFFFFYYLNQTQSQVKEVRFFYVTIASQVRRNFGESSPDFFQVVVREGNTSDLLEKTNSATQYN